jgi:long-chain acyl-CoA synthetase
VGIDKTSRKMNSSKKNDIYTLLIAAADTKGNDPFFIYNRQPVSYREALSHSQKFANYLRNIKIKKQDRVIIYLANVPEFIYTYLSLLQLGAISILINPATKRYEIRHIIEDSQPKLIITDYKNIQNIKNDDGFFYEPNKIILIDDDSTGNHFWKIIENEKPYDDFEDINDDDAITIIYTSAQEGFPLGAMLTNMGIYETSKEISKFSQEDDKFLTILPLFHSFGLTSSFITPLYSQLPFYLVNRISRQEIVDLVYNENISIFAGVPFMFFAMDMLFAYEKKIPKIRLAISGGESISINLQKKMKEKYDINIRQGYGLTEASPIVTWNNTDIENKFGTVGTAMMWNEVRFSNNGKDCTINDKGEILVKGINIIAGYYGQKNITAQIIQNGWLHTGDIGFIDSDGYVTITDRKKDMIIKKGLNVYPKEIKRILCNHPFVNDIHINSKIIRNEDLTTTESIEAIVYTKSGMKLDEKSFLDWCNINISKYKIPDSIIIK